MISNWLWEIWFSCYTDALVESRDADGEMFGPKGLLRMAESVNVEPSEGFIQSLLNKISERFSGNLSEDDVTVMLLRAQRAAGRVSRFRQKMGAGLQIPRARLIRGNQSPWA